MSALLRGTAAFLLGLTLSVCAIILGQNMVLRAPAEPPTASASPPPATAKLELRR
ncbi:hypothetical protein NK718_17395 [Alsobacter sp. SYSU M60028]|uniref:Uncharacterized protein n=1 Tax=Alsobacter ponti TaxID=2962936 RepID=A0ABT1LFN2_9HYPH|nr:hypothetical protein [Alsobacter ponti]MCP8940304.1 hypothetical protein [Alsobacter ponti]